MTLQAGQEYATRSETKMLARIEEDERKKATALASEKKDQ